MKRKVEIYLKQTYGEDRAAPDAVDGHYTFCKNFNFIHQYILIFFI